MPILLKTCSLTFVIILFSQFAFAQKGSIPNYAAVDSKVLKMLEAATKTTADIAAFINENFQTETDKGRAIFIWVASNIEYDIKNMFALNFYEKTEEKIAKSLNTRKGICENYAALFNEICNKSGLKSFQIEGYTKQNGFADYIPHAWCAARIDSTWYLFDPTWGSGYASAGKFYKKINNNYFKVAPNKLIKTHMPFDYLWQFLNYPISNAEFYEGKTSENKSKPFFSYADSIQLYESQSHTEQLKNTAARIEKNGLKNSMIFARLEQIKAELENTHQSNVVGLYNSAILDYNYGVNSFKDFINYRNKQFQPLKSDDDIQSMLDTPESNLKAANGKLKSIENPDANTAAMQKQLAKSIEDASIQVAEQQLWLTEYMKKGKSGRRSMFYKTKLTWFGIPLN